MFVKDIPPYVVGSPILAAHLEAFRQKLAQDVFYSQGVDEQTGSTSTDKNTAKSRWFRVYNTGAGIPKYSVFGLKDAAALNYLDNYMGEVDITSTKTDWLLTNSNHVLENGMKGWALPISQAIPVKVRYGGTTPQINDLLGVSGGLANKDLDPKVLVAVSNPDAEHIWVTRLPGGVGAQVSFMEFTTAATFTTADDEVAINPITDNVPFWTGEIPNPYPTVVKNSGNIFFGPVINLYGIAVRVENEDATNTNAYQILQLECISPSVHIISSTSLGTFDYDATPETVPLNTDELGQGDLIQIEANGELTLTRDAYGLLEVTLQSAWGNQLGSTVEQSAIEIETNLGGGGWVSANAGTFITHTYLRIPPDDYILGGSAVRSYPTVTVWSAGDQIRLRARSANNTLMTSLEDVNLTLDETFVQP